MTTNAVSFRTIADRETAMTTMSCTIIHDNNEDIVFDEAKNFISSLLRVGPAVRFNHHIITFSCDEDFIPME